MLKREYSRSQRLVGIEDFVLKNDGVLLKELKTVLGRVYVVAPSLVRRDVTDLARAGVIILCDKKVWKAKSK